MTKRDPVKLWSSSAIFIAALMLYFFTLNADVQPADSGELQLAAYMLQIPHPPGYPLLTLLGWLAAHIPVATVFARLSFLSAAIAALTITITFINVLDISDTLDNSDTRHSYIARLYPLLWAGIAATALATSTTFWAQATTFNVRSLTALFTALMVYSAVLSRRHPRRALWLMAGVIGLGVGHHASLVFVAALMGLYALWRAVRAGLPRRDYVITLAALLGTQLVWLLLPLRNNVPGVLAHGNLRSLSGLLDHVLARGFGNDFFYFVLQKPDQLWDRLAAMPTLFLFQFSPAVLVAMAIGLVLMLIYQRGLGVLIIAAIALHWFVTITYKAPQTVEYAIPCWVLMSVGLGGGRYLLALGVRLGEGEPRPYWGWVYGGVAILLMVIAGIVVRDGAQRWPSYRALARDHRTRADAEGMLRYPNLDEQVFSEWHQATPMWALQAIDGIRPDVRVTYVSPTGTQPYEETFAERAAQSAQHGRTYITSHFPNQLAAQHLVSFPLSNTAGWRVDQTIDFASINFVRTVWDERIILVHPLGLPSAVSVGQQINLDMWWSSRGRHIEGDSITVRILFPDGRLATNADVRLTGQEGIGTVSFKRVGFAIPWHLPPGDYTLLAGAYNGGTLYKTADGVDFMPVGRLHITPSNFAPITQQPYPFSTPNNTLIGIDYDLGLPDQMRVWTHWQLGPITQTAVLRNSSDAWLNEATLPPQTGPSPQYLSLAFDVSPQQGLHLELAGESYDLPHVEPGARYVPFADQMVLVGSTRTQQPNALTVDLRWRAVQPMTDDYRISVRVQTDAAYLTHDGYPALGTIPAFKWIRNTEIVDRHPFTLTAQAKPPQVSVVVYNFTTRLDLLPLDERYQGEVGIE